MKTPSKILLFRQSSLGDVILTLPVIKELRRAFPDAVIDFLTKMRYAPVVQHDPAVRKTVVFNNNAEFKMRLKQIRSEKYDLIIDLQRNFRSMALSIFSAGSRRIKYKKRRLAREIIVRKPSLNLSVDHTVNAYFHALKRLGIQSNPTPPEISLSDKAADFAERFISESFPELPSHIIALCPGARHPEKKWPSEDFKDVARILLEDNTVGLFVISSSSDEVPENLGLSDSRAVPVLDFEILDLAALLSHCKVAVSNDSGLMHLANAVGTKVVAIFGPTSPRLGFSPTLPGSRIVTGNAPCSPCSLHGERKCRQKRKFCFENIRPGQVAECVKNML